MYIYIYSIYIYFLGPILGFSWILSNPPRNSDCIRRLTPVFHICSVIILFQAAGVYGLCGHLALWLVVLENRGGTASVSDWLLEALLVWVILPSNKIAIPILVEVS